MPAAAVEGTSCQVEAPASFSRGTAAAATAALPNTCAAAAAAVQARYM
mgnify:CR=1 FL=1